MSCLIIVVFYWLRRVQATCNQWFALNFNNSILLIVATLCMSTCIKDEVMKMYLYYNYSDVLQWNIFIQV